MDQQKKTSKCGKFFFNVCLAYDGREEILYAVKKIVGEIQDNTLNENELSCSTIKNHLFTREIPEPDLIIRTGMKHEKRISGFLLWDSSYSELEFVEHYWPDFTPVMLGEIISRFSERIRRFGQ